MMIDTAPSIERSSQEILNLLFLWTVQLLQLLIKFWVQGSIYLHCIRCAITATHLPYFMVCIVHTSFRNPALASSSLRHRSEQPLTYGEERAVPLRLVSPGVKQLL